MKTSFYAVRLASAVVLVPLIAGAQLETGIGTLVILESTQDEIVVAADSRMHVQQRELDDRCKITALGNELIFAASGTTQFFFPDPRFAWDAHTIARNVFRRLSQERTKEPMPLRLANAWRDEVKKKLKADLRRDPQETIQGAYENSLIDAIFAGFDGNSPLIVRGSITYTKTASGQFETNFSISDLFREPGVEMIGHSDVAYELFEGRTDRAHQWRHDMKARIRKDDDPIAFVAIDAVRFSMANQPLEKIGNEMVQPIGGPIDAVRLKRMGGIDWIQRKENCPSN
jgi:hypothetical protein